MNLAAAVKAAGKRVLLCDFDPQANATSGMGVDKSTSNGVYDVIMNGASTESVIVSTPTATCCPAARRWPAQAWSSSAWMTGSFC